MTDIAKAHDIVSMFCDENMNYNGMINTGKGTGPSWVTKYTAKAWEEIYEMPDSMRESCQAALMNFLERFLSGGECTEGLNGEKAELKDYARFLEFGFDAMGDSATKVVMELLKEEMVDDCAIQLIDKAVEKGWLPEDIADEVKEEMNEAAERYMESYELITDMDQIMKYQRYSVDNTLVKRLGSEEPLWDDSYRYKMGEKCIDYAVNGYEDLKEDTQQIIVAGEAGWSMIQELSDKIGEILVKEVKIPEKLQ